MMSLKNSDNNYFILILLCGALSVGAPLFAMKTKRFVPMVMLSKSACNLQYTRSTRFYSNMQQITPTYFFNGLAEVKNTYGKETILYRDQNKFILKSFRPQLLKGNPIFVDYSTVQRFVEEAPERYLEAKEFFSHHFGMDNPEEALYFTYDEIKEGIITLNDGQKSHSSLTDCKTIEKKCDSRSLKHVYYHKEYDVRRIAPEVFIENVQQLVINNLSRLPERWQIFDTKKGMCCFVPVQKNTIDTRSMSPVYCLEALNQPNVEWAADIDELVSCVKGEQKSLYLMGHGSNPQLEKSYEPIIAGLAESTMARMLSTIEKHKQVGLLALFSCFTFGDRVKQISEQYNQKQPTVDVLTATTDNKRVYLDRYESTITSYQKGDYRIDSYAPSFADYFEELSQSKDRQALTWNSYLACKDQRLRENIDPHTRPELIAASVIQK